VFALMTDSDLGTNCTSEKWADNHRKYVQARDKKRLRSRKNTQGFSSAEQNERRCSRHTFQYTSDLYKKRERHQDIQVVKSDIHHSWLSLSRQEGVMEIDDVSEAKDLVFRSRTLRSITGQIIIFREGRELVDCWCRKQA